MAKKKKGGGEVFNFKHNAVVTIIKVGSIKTAINSRLLYLFQTYIRMYIQ